MFSTFSFSAVSRVASNADWQMQQINHVLQLCSLITDVAKRGAGENNFREYSKISENNRDTEYDEMEGEVSFSRACRKG